MLDAAAICHWVETAPAEASAVYAVGAAPPRPIAVVVASLAAQGLVAPVRKRLVDGSFQFQMQRSAKSAATGRTRIKRYPRASAENVLLRIAQECARRGMPFPTNRALADRCGLSGAVSVSYRLRKLVRDGLIQVEDFGPYERRVVTVVATGKASPRATIDGLLLAGTKA